MRHTGYDKKFFEAGNDDYLSKPLKKEDLLCKLKAFGLIE